MKFNPADIESANRLNAALDSRLQSNSQNNIAELNAPSTLPQVDVDNYQLIIDGPVDCDDCVSLNIDIPERLLARLDKLASGPYSVLVELALEHMVDELESASDRGDAAVTLNAFDLQAMFGLSAPAVIEQTQDPVSDSHSFGEDLSIKKAALDVPQIAVKSQAFPSLASMAPPQDSYRQFAKPVQSKFIRAPQFRRRSIDQNKGF